jgi:ribonuclease P protein component
VLARANRVVRGDEFRIAVRRGRRVSGDAAVYHLMDRPEQPARYGFIVTKAVGGAVERNRLRRRWRAIARELVDAGDRGRDVVLRARPGAAERTWTELRDEARRVLLTGSAR